MTDDRFEMRKFAPLKAGHPAIGEKCILCGELILENDETTLIPIVPAGEEEKKKMLADRPFIAEAKLAHWRCWEFVREFTKE